MKKVFLLLTAVSMLATGAAYAAPISDLNPGKVNIGYQHYDMNDSLKADSVYLEGAVSDKVILGVERNGYAFSRANDEMTDIYAQYKLDQHLRLIVGNRNYEDGPNKIFAGIGGYASLGEKLDGYASVTGSSIATEWQAGLTYNMDGQTALQLGFKSYKEDYAPTRDGIGFGISHKF